MSNIKKDYGVITQKVDEGQILQGSIAFSAGDVLTTEKKTASLSIIDKVLHPNNLYLLVIDKPVEDTAGDLTIELYNDVKVDTTNSRDVKLATLTVEKITGADTYRSFLVQGLGMGEGTIKLGMSFATDSGAIEVFYKLYRI